MLLLVLQVMASPVLAGEKSTKTDKSENVAIPKELLHREKIATDHSLYITAEEAQVKIKAKSAMLVDVRSNENFQLYRIPGSIHIELYAVKTKVFLKDKFLVLVSEGSSYSAIEKECRKLKSAGFTTGILQGGLNCWSQNNYPIEGDMLAMRSVSEMTPQNALNEIVYDRWVILNVSDSDKSRIGYYFPDSIPIPYSDDDKRFLSKIKDKLAQYKDPSYSLLIVDEDTKDYPRIEKIFKDASFNNIFFLKGAIHEYESVLKNQVESWQKDNKRTITTKKCKTCT